MCIFSNEDNIQDKNILFINTSNIKFEDIEDDSNALYLKFLKLIEINENDLDKKPSNEGFYFTLSKNKNNELKIICTPNKDFHPNSLKEHKVLSRDNFINEIYTK